MARHFTPVGIAEYVARYISEDTKNLLEPCVGHGDLIRPLVNCLSDKTYFTCIDKNESSLKVFAERFKHIHRRVTAVKADFLQWCNRRQSTSYEKFDCVLMNPPFSGQRQMWKPFSFCRENEDASNTILKHVPTEAAFVLKSLRHLKGGGTVVAIVPNSIIAGTNLQWVRKELVACGQIVLVHELPRFAFPQVEARLFILVYKKDGSIRPTKLLNHELANPLVSEIDLARNNPDLRLDFTYVEAHQILTSIAKRKAELNWVRLDQLAEIARGNVSAPFPKVPILHSTDFSEGFWGAACKKNSQSRSNVKVQLLAKPGDILAVRVGRGASKSIGILLGRKSRRFSDCVFRIRASSNVKISRITLLLLLRALYSSGYFSPVLERGTGATYITAEALRGCLIPSRLPFNVRELEAQYRKSLLRRDFPAMLSIEQQVREHIVVPTADLAPCSTY